jgi:hypothetical protein
VATLDPARGQMRMLFGVLHRHDPVADQDRRGAIAQLAGPSDLAHPHAGGAWPALREEAAYELLLTPGQGVRPTAVPSRWRQDYEVLASTLRS